jgi:hypothetical protein
MHTIFQRTTTFRHKVAGIEYTQSDTLSQYPDGNPAEIDHAPQLSQKGYKNTQSPGKNQHPGAKKGGGRLHA